MRMCTRTAAVAMTALVVALSGGASLKASNGAKPPQVEYLGQAIIPTGTTFGGTTIGGLSSITYDEARGLFYTLSDDQANVRYYTLQIDVSDGHLDNGDVQFLAVTKLLAPNGQPYATASIDPEGLTFSPKTGELIVTSEGFAARNIAPWVRRYALDGTYLADLFVPDAFTVLSPTHGVRQNLAFEAAAIAPDGRHLFVGMEGALVQDGPAATPTGGSTSRILRYNLQTGRLDRQFVLPIDPVTEVPVPPNAFSVNGLVELLPFNTQFMLAMERSFSVGVPGTGNKIYIHFLAFPGADDVNGADSIAGQDVATVSKTLVLNLDDLGIPLDNIEGMVVGPTLPDGRRSLILVSDNNFAASQFTQFLMFAID
jgi:3-phytase/alkaline phosphatase D